MVTFRDIRLFLPFLSINFPNSLDVVKLLYRKLASFLVKNTSKLAAHRNVHTT